jgi:hypothetical protein
MSFWASDSVVDVFKNLEQKPPFLSSRLVFLVELGTHAITDAFLSPYRLGERIRARQLLRSVESGMLLMWDRGLHSFKMVKAAARSPLPHFRSCTSPSKV